MENVCCSSTTKEFCGFDPDKTCAIYFINSALPVEADRITWSALTWKHACSIKNPNPLDFGANPVIILI